MKKEPKETNIMIVETLYSLFLYLLLCKQEETFFLVSSDFYRGNEKLIKQLANYEIIDTTPHIRKNHKVLKKIDTHNYYRNIGRHIQEKKLSEYRNVYGLDHTILGNYCIGENFILLEDGTQNYFLKKIRFSDRIRKLTLGRNFKFGRDPRIQKIYLTGLAPVPNEIVDKVEQIDLKCLWQQKSEQEKIDFLKIFDLSETVIEKIKQCKYILFTQPLSEDNILLEDEKIALYDKILNQYDRSKIVLKSHPREFTKYEEYFPNIQIIPKNFPSELFYLLDIEFEKSITIFSTAALNLKNSEIDFYGTEVHPKIFQKMGNMDYCMKRTAFLSCDILR